MDMGQDEPTDIEIKVVRSIVYTVTLVLVFGAVWLFHIVEAS